MLNKIYDDRPTRLALSIGLALLITLVVSALSIVTLEGVGAAMRYQPPDAMEFTFTNGSLG